MAEDARYTHPLMGVVICCTSISPEIRSDVSSKANAMGAVHRQDLTSDVTHLIVGDLDTPKYKYVAKNRIDVKVVDAEWVAAMHEKWITGEDIKIAEFEEEYRYLPFQGMKISVTNISDCDERIEMQNIMTSNGGAYHPDLTREVTHLIAAIPEGKKYEFARKWGIRIVSPEWLFHSIERGMALDEDCYDPKLPEKRIGVGARPESPIIKKENATGEVHGSVSARGSKPPEEQLQIGKRKIREDFTRMIEGHSQSIWDDIMGQASNARVKKRDEWDETRDHDVKIERPKLSRKRRTIQDDEDEDNEDNDGEGSKVNPGQSKTAILPEEMHVNKGIFKDRTFCVYGFEDSHKVEILKTAIESHSGVCITIQDLKQAEPRPVDGSAIFVVAPEVFPKRLHPQPSGEDNLKIVSFWWVERCIHRKQFIEPKHPNELGDYIDILCFPFESMPLEGFEGMEIVTTGFTGVNLMHITKTIGLLGARYQDTVNARKTNLIISAIDSAKTDKAQAGLNWNIPVVTVRWLASCLSRGAWVELDDFLVKGVRKRVRANDDEERKRPRQGDAQLTPILSGYVVAVSKTLEESHAAELKLLAGSLGATVVDKFSRRDANLLTHLVHLKNGSEGISREYRTAKTISGCFIVSPNWLHECKRVGSKVDEKAYPPSVPLEQEKHLDLNNEPAITSNKPPTKKVLISTSLVKGRRNPFEVDDSEAEDSDARDLSGLNGGIEPSKGLHARSPSPILELVNEEQTTRPTNTVATKPALTEFLKLGIDKLSTALDKPRKPRGRLQGKATSIMSAFPGAAISREDSSGSSLENGSVLLKEDSLQSRNSSMISGISGSTSEASYYLTQPPLQSQAVSYADPEAQIERKKMMAKLDGIEAAADTPAKPTKEPRAVLQDVLQDMCKVRRSTRYQNE